MTSIPIFPLRSVLCPGLALPLHIFEPRYRLMIDRCLEADEPFGVVLIREGREVGPLQGSIAAVGTTAAIRRAGRHPDGRLDILTVGQRRFRVEAVDSASQPYLVGEVRFLDEPTGASAEVALLAPRVGDRFLEYLDLLQPGGTQDGPEIEIEFEIEVDDEGVSGVEDVPSGPLGEGRIPPGEPSGAADGGSDSDIDRRREQLMAAARSLVATEDPTALSYVLTALVQVDLSARQALLEAPDTQARLVALDRLLGRERWFLRQGLRPVIIDASGGLPHSS